MKKIEYTLAGEKYDIPCVAYEPSGEIRGAVVCLHGFGGDKDSSAVKKLGEKMAERGYAVVCFDFPAHGKSPAKDDMLRVENCINDAITVSANAENEYGGICFFATSFGAFILANLLKKPCFKGVKAVFRSPAVKMADTFLNPICNLTIDELKKKSAVECGFERKIKLGYDFWLDLESNDITDASFDNEVLMIYGNCDNVVRPEDMAEFASARENIKVKIINGADHRFKGKGQLEEVISASSEFLAK